VAAGSAGGFPAAALAAGGNSGTRPESTASTAPVTASVDALAAAGNAAAATAPAGQPTSPTAAAPQPAAPAAPQPGATLQPQLAKPLFTLAGAPQGQHIMTLQVTPEDLGPMTVRAHIDAAGVRIELFAPGDAGREAIRGILPELRKELADAGFGASLDVSDHTGPGTTARDGTSQDSASRDGAARDSGSAPGNRNGTGDQRPGHRWEALADGDALREKRILNGPQTTLDILV
jgi:Meckel syndrome type 1 protein